MKPGWGTHAQWGEMRGSLYMYMYRAASIHPHLPGTTMTPLDLWQDLYTPLPLATKPDIGTKALGKVLSLHTGSEPDDGTSAI